MSSLIEEEHEEGHDEEPWLVSYADLMTLLFGFFVVMYSFAAAKLGDETVQMRKEVAQFFGGGIMNPLEESIKEVTEIIKAQPNGDEVVKDMGVSLFPEGVEISFTSVALFASGSANLAASAKEAIDVLASHIVTNDSDKEKWDIRVEGHTDDAPIRFSKVYPSNWELSGARAAAVIRIFEEKGFNKQNLRAIGYSDTRPVAPNRDENGDPIAANRSKNRRIVIKISLTDAAQREEIEKQMK